MIEEYHNYYMIERHRILSKIQKAIDEITTETTNFLLERGMNIEEISNMKEKKLQKVQQITQRKRDKFNHLAKSVQAILDK